MGAPVVRYGLRSHYWNIAFPGVCEKCGASRCSPQYSTWVSRYGCDVPGDRCALQASHQEKPAKERTQVPVIFSVSVANR